MLKFRFQSYGWSSSLRWNGDIEKRKELTNGS